MTSTTRACPQSVWGDYQKEARHPERSEGSPDAMKIFHKVDMAYFFRRFFGRNL